MSKLHIDSVVKFFGIRELLSDVFLSCEQGEIIGLLGRNGSGKSTLLKIVFGAEKTNNKFVKVDDKLIVSLYDGIDLIRYLPQDSFLPGHLQIKQIISVFCAKPQAEKLYEHDFVKPYLRQKSDELSGGERRIIEILMLVHSEAPFLLLDEPFNGIAPLHVEIIKDIIREHSHNKGFIITDHDYVNILDVSSRVVLLYEGAIKAINEKSDLVRWGYLSPSHL